MKRISAKKAYLIILCLASLNVGLSQIEFKEGSSAVVFENTTAVVFDANATDGAAANDVGITYSLSGTDASNFTLDTENGELRFVSSPDWDAPTDADQDNIYEIEITANNDVSKSVQIFVVPKVKDGLGEFSQLGADIDGEADNDRSGTSVSMSADGSVVAIGASGSYNGGVNGYVRVYAYDGTSWGQLGLDINGEAANDYSGAAVSLSANGSIVAIGATGNDDNGDNAGHVRVYAYNGISWEQLGADIDGEATGDYSGGAVSLSDDGSIVAIGAIGNDGNNGYDDGHVRVYEYNGTSWIQLGLDIDSEESVDRNGFAVSLSADGKTVATSAIYNEGSGPYSGHVRIYTYDGTLWRQLGTDIDGEESGDESGSSVSLSANGSVVAIGSKRNDDNGSYAGHVRIYTYDGTLWRQLGTDIDGEESGDESGSSVSLSADGSVVAIGAYLNDGNGSNAGHVRIYRYDGTSWEQLGIDIDGETAGSQSGGSVSLSADGTKVAIGAISNDGNGTDAGHVRVYSLKDITAPSVSSTTLMEEIEGEEISSNTTYSFEDSLWIAVTYDEKVRVTGEPSIALTSLSNKNAVFDTLISPDSTIAYFLYVISNNEDDINVDDPEVSLTVANTIDLNGGTIKDVAGNNAALDISMLTIPSQVLTNTNDNLLSTKGSTYPNPCTDRIQLDLGADFNNVLIEVFNSQGVLVKTMSGYGKTHSIDLSEISSGLYILSVNADGKLGNQKIMKE